MGAKFSSKIAAAAVLAGALLGAAADAKTFDIPTGAPRSPLFGTLPFTQRILLFEEFGTRAMPSSYAGSYAPLPQPLACNGTLNAAAADAFMRQSLYPAPGRDAEPMRANPWAAAIGACIGRTLATSYEDGRPPGEYFGHQRWDEFYPSEWFQSITLGARDNTGLRDSYQRHGFTQGEFGPSGLYHYGGTNRGVQVRFHPNFPVQNANAIWTFDGTLPPKLLQARYGHPVLFRHYNGLPIDQAANGGFGRHSLTTHHHNGHNPAESDGFTAAFFMPGQYYDYHWPMILAGHDRINDRARDKWAGTPNGSGGITKIRGDWRETMSTMWFHDHMLDFTAQNVYKGSAAMMNLYSAIDRGKEGLQCNYANANNPNMCFPSGTALDWGNRDYDVNLIIADKAWDAQGQLFFNIFNLDGFLGDQVLVNWTWRPYMEVRARRYRFRILNGSVSRYYKLALVTASGVRVPFHMIANDGNIMEHAIPFPNPRAQDLPEIAIAERYDIVVDFAQMPAGSKLYLVNLLEHDDGRRPREAIPLGDVMAGRYNGDPGVGRIMEFRIVRYTGRDRSMDPTMYEPGGRTMIPLPEVTTQEVNRARRRSFDFGRSNNTDETPWTIKVDGGRGYGMDPHRVSAAPTENSWEVWRLNSGDGWAHPVHIHFEEGRILSRDGAPPPDWERYARKDVFRIGAGPDTTENVEVLIRFREFLGTYMEHCHNTQHEDHSMLLRWDNRAPGQILSIPTPINSWEGVVYEPSFELTQR